MQRVAVINPKQSTKIGGGIHIIKGTSAANNYYVLLLATQLPALASMQSHS
jgi:hypothetical protein